jgi:hypothetical protein
MHGGKKGAQSLNRKIITCGRFEADFDSRSTHHSTMSASTTYDETNSKVANTNPSDAQKAVMAAIARAGWAGYQTLIYAHDKPVDTLDLARLEREAKEELGHGAFYYVNGSAGVSATYEANLKALREWKIVPRMMKDATKRDLSVCTVPQLGGKIGKLRDQVIPQVTLFGTKYTSPVVIAPIGVQGIVHPDAELATARAAKALGIPMTLSTAATRSIEHVAEANGDGDRWFQLYWFVPRFHTSNALVDQNVDVTTGQRAMI